MTQEIHRLEDVALTCGVKAGDVHIWVERRWVLPVRDAAGLAFNDADMARARLIAELEHDLDIDTEAVPVILSLLDRVHGLRRQLRLMTAALLELPPEHRSALCRRLLERPGDDPADPVTEI